MSLYSVIYTASDGTVTLQSLTSTSTGAYVTGATVTGVLTDSTGNPVAGWNPITFTDQGSGNYQASFAAANVPSAGTYTLKITVVSGTVTLTLLHTLVVQNYAL